METDVTPPVPATEEVVTHVEKGSKTPPENLYAALEEERRLRKELEARLAQEREKVVEPLPETQFSDEGLVLKTQLGKLETQLEDLQKEREAERVFNSYPALKEKSSEFNEFSKDYPRHKLESVAKIFLAEKGMLENQPRMGLEKPTAGPKDTTRASMSVDDIAHLRNTNYRKYLELIQNGKINPNDIK